MILTTHCGREFTIDDFVYDAIIAAKLDGTNFYKHGKKN